MRSLILLHRNCLSVNMIGQCRFMPTCSEYALRAIDKHGALLGAWMILLRLLKCRPGFFGGYDPVR